MLSLHGDVRVADGTFVVTAGVLQLLPHPARAATREAVYRLGKPNRIFLGWTRAHGFLLGDFARITLGAVPRSTPRTDRET